MNKKYERIIIVENGNWESIHNILVNYTKMLNNFLKKDLTNEIDGN